MILFTLLLLLNFTLDHQWLLDVRVEVGGLPVNVLDAAMMLAIMVLPITMRRNRSEAAVHSGYVWCVTLQVVALLVGVIGAMIADRPLRDFVTFARNLACLPLAMLIGYMVVRRVESVKNIVIVWIVCNIAGALSLIWQVRTVATENIGYSGQSFDRLRDIYYGGDAGLTSAAFLAAMLVGQMRVLNMAISIPVILFCLLSMFLLPHRGSFVIGTVLMFTAVMLLPRVPLQRRITASLVALLLISVTVVVAVTAVSRISGRDFGRYLIERRVKQLIPGYEEETKTTVMATRLPGIQRELRAWLQNPFFGQGLALSRSIEAVEGQHGMNHNVWTSALAQMGLAGLGAYLVPILCCIVIGWRMWREHTTRHFALFGAMAFILGLIAFFMATLSQSINVQRQAIPAGLMFGLLFRVRALQMEYAREYADYLDPNPSIVGAEPTAHMRWTE